MNTSRNRLPSWLTLALAAALMVSSHGCGDSGNPDPGGSDADQTGDADGPGWDASAGDAGTTPADATGDAAVTGPTDTSTPDNGAVADADATVAPRDIPTTPPDLGPPADPMVCTGKTDGHLQEFGGACCYTGEDNPYNPNCVWYDDNYDGDVCLDGQCADGGFCSSGRYCSRGCLVYADSVNNATGEPGQDGIVDPGAGDDCIYYFPADGPFGTDYRCVNVRNPTQDPAGICRPGTDFADCLGDDDCPEGESCQVLFVRGVSEKRCMTKMKGSVGLGETCNSDPNGGEVSICSGPLCYSFGCADSCGDDDHCDTDQCVEGECAKQPGVACETPADCSAMFCRSLEPYSNSDYSDTFCWPRDCASAADCKDPDWFCRPFWNGASTVEEIAFAPACRPKEPELAAYGEACGFAGDGSGLPECAWGGGCIDGYCSGPCTSDDDCNADDDAECLRGAEWSLDVDDDEEVDAYLDVDLCITWPHEGDIVECVTDTDCPEAHHCQYRIKGDGLDADRAWRVEFVCRSDTDDQVGFGEVCGGTDGGTCGSDLCLVPGGGGSDAMCTQYCASADDCPETLTFDELTWKTLCLSFPVANNGTLDEIDDIYVPYCWRTSSIGSVSECDEERQCADAKEYCRAIGIAGNVDEAVIMEHRCVDASSGLDAFPDKEVGEACESWQECRGRTCLPDGAGGGYCSALCGTDEACKQPDGALDLRCTDWTVLGRPDDELSGKSARCVLAATCVSCDDDESCGGETACINNGGLGDLADLRCAEQCEPEAGCENPLHSCTEHISPTGVPTGIYGCLPDVCEDP